MKEKQNISAGAEKVENLARKGELQGSAAKGALTEKEAKERERAERRVQEAIARRERGGREERKEERERAPGFGGWLAAVVSLSVAVLALGAIVTVGYFDLTASKNAMTDSYRAAVYEFSEHVEGMSADLSKVRVADGRELQLLLTDVLVHGELAERSLEGMPCDGENAAALSAFFNRCSGFSRRMLRKLAAGGSLTEEEERAADYLYETCERLRERTPALIEGAENCVADELLAAGGAFDGQFAALRESVGELPAGLSGVFGGAAPAPAEGEDIGERAAAERAQAYFAEYEPENMRVTGKTEGRLPCYAVEFEASGVQYAAQIAADGRLAFFDCPGGGTARNYGGEDAVRIARRFLERCGYEGLCCVWVSESGAEACVEFAAEQGGAVLYADRILVKVCEDRGCVTGAEARAYLENHRAREIGEAHLSAESVERAAAARMDEVTIVRPALLPSCGEEVLCWEVRGSAGGREYIAFVNAENGSEEAVYVVVGTGRGQKVI